LVGAAVGAAAARIARCFDARRAWLLAGEDVMRMSMLELELESESELELAGTGTGTGTGTGARTGADELASAYESIDCARRADPHADITVHSASMNDECNVLESVL
ncbi:hypothetical protein QQS21_012938, partial [Conoideocrella luteorostrata]